ncbi:MAG: hypothetical protein ACOCRL_01385 [Bacillota bacterium]
MPTDKIIKLAVLNIGVAIIGIVFFSEGLIGLSIGESVFETSLAVTIIFMSLIIFVVGNYLIFFQEKKVIHSIDLKTEEDCIDALKNIHLKTFNREIECVLDQIYRFDKKEATIKDILLQKFDDGGMSYSKFEGAVLNVQNVFFLNIKSIINKLNAFDEDDYHHIKNPDIQKDYSEEFMGKKKSIYNEYIDFVKESVEDNEEILLKLDSLLLEISNFSSLEDGEIEEMSAMKEIDELINNTKLYK